MNSSGGKQSRNLRTILRWFHSVAGAMIAIMIYSPLGDNDAFVLLVQIAVLPIVILTGFWMWQQARVRRLLRGFSTARTG